MKIRFVVLAVILIIRLTMPLKADDQEFFTVSWSPNGDKIAVFNPEQLTIYDSDLVVQQTMTLSFSDKPIRDMTVVWSPMQDKVALYAGEDYWDIRSPVAWIQIWDINAGKKLGEVSNFWYAGPKSVLWLPDNEHFSTYSGRTLYVYQSDGILDYTWIFPPDHGDALVDPPEDAVADALPIISMAWGPEAHSVVINSTDGYPILVWDITTKKFINEVMCNCPMEVLTIVSSPGGQYLAIRDESAFEIEVFSIDSAARPAKYPPVNYYDNDNRVLLFGWWDSHRFWTIFNNGFIYTWRLKTNAVLEKEVVDLSQLQTVSPDGTKALYGQQHELRIEEIKTGLVLASTTLSGEAVFPEDLLLQDPIDR